MKFHGFVLDKFQNDACRHIENGDSVVVSASTGTGKTLVAEYAIDLYTSLDKRSVYTSPIKALSNQKYRDFVRQFGPEKVGILTGDVSINPHAQILVMTTEVYRNMALSDPGSIEDVGILILDEIHFMNDPERGTVWEESIIFSPDTVRFLALSATIPNAREFAQWIASIHNHPVKVVEHMKRAVPLEHYFFQGGCLSPYDELKRPPRNYSHRGRHYVGRTARRGSSKSTSGTSAEHLDLVRFMRQQDMLPCLFFDFSRKNCEKKAMDAAHRLDLAEKKKRPDIRKIIDTYLPAETADMESVAALKFVLEKGVAFHHAGMLPQAKRAVEEAFAQNLVKVLYATETFAVGINYPARTVAFASLRKYDGINHRYLNSKEYFQMAGRAGRRGMDEIGRAIALVDPWRDDIREIREFTREDNIPIISQFQLSYNTVLNLIQMHQREEIGQILKRSFDSFLKKRSGERINVWASWNNRVRMLRTVGCLDGDEITSKGLFASKIFTQELVTTELFHGRRWKSWSDVDICCLAAAVVYEGRRGFRFPRPKRRDRFFRLVSTIQDSGYLMRNLNLTGLNIIIPTVEKWTMESTLRDVMQLSNLVEGDLIRLFRQTIDLLGQVRRATDEQKLKDRVDKAIGLLDKDVVCVDFR